MMINKKQMWSDNPFDQWTEEELLCMKYQGICYGKGGGSAPPPPPATQTVRQSSEFPEELKPFVSDIFSKAQAVQEQRQEEGFRPELTQQLASFTPDQQAAFTGIREQVGQTRPLFEEATNLARGATRAATDPAEVAALMNPFLRNVTDIEKREAQRVADVQEQQLAAQAAQAGAFGGSRAAVLEAERQRNLAQQLGDIEARGRAAAFQDAQARLQNQFAREGAGAAQLSALGAAIPAQTFKELGALSGIGAAEQQQTQRALDIATQQAREEYGFPMQTLQDFQSILRGFPLPATTNVSRQTFSPAQPLATQLLGLGTSLAGLAGAAGAFKKAGGLVGVPVAMKDGGYVKLAGGGGLGQLMQGKLPSNRVRMGKTAYQDVSRIPISPVASMPVQLTKEEAKKLVDEVKFFIYGDSPMLDADNPKTFAQQVRRPSKLEIASYTNSLRQRYGDDVAEKIFKAAGLPNLEMVAGSEPGSMVAKEILKAGKDTPDVPVPAAQAKNPADLSLLQKAMGTLDDLVTGVPSSKKLSSIMSPPLVDDQAQTVTTNLNLPQLLSGQTLDPGGADALPQPGMRQSIQERYPLKITPRVDRTPPPEMAELDAKPQLSMLQSLQERYPLKITPRVNRPSLGLLPSSPVTAAPPPAALPLITQMGMEGLPEDDGQTRTRGMSQYQIEGEIERGRRQEAARRRNIQGDIGQSAVEIAQERSKIFTDPTVPDELDAAQKDADAVRTREVAKAKAEAAATKAADPDGGAAADGATNKGAPSPGTNPAQIDYNAKIAEFKDKDYSAEIEKALGPAPTYEKGEEPDFASQKYLTLLGIGARILSSNKPALQALGDAVQPAIKELADIGKEERKIQRELRQERNAQKRADYQDKSARFNMLRQLRGDDIDMFTSLARLREQQESNKISAQNAETNRNRMLSENAARKVQRLEKEFNLKLEKEGKLSYGEVDKLIDSVLKRASKQAVAGAKDTLTGLTDPTKIEEVMSAAYQSELPFLLDRIDGRVIGKDGKTVVPRSELMKLLGMKTASAPKGGGGNQTFQARRGQDGKLIQ